MMEDGFQWVEHWLNVWAQYMRTPDLRLGLPVKACGFAGGGYGENRELLEDWEAEGDSRAAGIINAVLEDLPVIERAAIMHVKLKSTFGFHVEPEIPYRNARMKCGVRLRREVFA